jgi:hypothetical protein
MHGVSVAPAAYVTGGGSAVLLYAATACDLHHLHGTGMGIWSSNDKRIPVCRIGREVRREPFAGEALIVWEVTHHIMTSAHEWI